MSREGAYLAQFDFREILRALEGYGILLASDAHLPSVTAMVAGESVRGSWWGHPRRHEMYRAILDLEEHPDVVEAKLVSSKVTYVHRGLWPDLLGVGSAREPWQLEGMTTSARQLLDEIDRIGQVRTDRLPPSSRIPSGVIGERARDLERKLLVHGESVHTERGAHAKLLETWGHWADRVGYAGGMMAPVQGKQRLAMLLDGLNGKFGGNGTLPWSRFETARETKR